MSSLKTVMVALLWIPLVVSRQADPAGTWRAEFSGPGGTKGAEVLKLTVKAGVVTGTFENAVGGIGPVRDGKWDGTTLRFWVSWDTSDKLEATGTLADTTLNLELKTSKWAAKRAFKRQP